MDKLADEIADFIIGFIRVVLASGVFWLLSAIYTSRLTIGLGTVVVKKARITSVQLFALSC